MLVLDSTLNNSDHSTLEATKEISNCMAKSAPKESEIDRLKAESRLLDQLLNDSGAAIYIKDLKGRYTYVNDQCASHFGMRRKALIGKSDSELIPGLDKRFSEREKKIFKTGQEIEYEDVSAFPGRRYRFHTRKIPLFNEAGKVIGLKGYSRDITATHETENKYRFIFDNAPVAFWEEDMTEVNIYLEKLKKRGVKNFSKYLSSHPEHVINCIDLIRIRNLNKAAKKMYSRKESPERIKDISRVFDAKSERIFLEEFVALAEGKTSYNSEATTIDKNGKRNHVLFVMNVLPGHEEALDLVLVSMTDFTERKTMEEELDHLRRLYRSVIETQKEMIVRFDEVGSIKFFNQAFNRFFLHRTRRRKNHLISDFLSEKISDRLVEVTTELKLGEIVNLEYKTTDSKKQTVWQNWTIQQVETVEGLIEFQCSGRDITAQKNAEQELAESEARWRSFFQHSSDRIIIVDKNLRIVATNMQAKFDRAKPEDVIGSKITDEIQKDQRKGATALFKNVFEKGVTSQGEYVGSPERGSNIFEVVVSPILSNGNVEMATIVARDVTEKRKSEEERLANEARWQSILNHAQDMIFTVNEDMVITSANTTAQEVIGGNVEGSTIKAAMLSKNAETVENMVTSAFETSGEFNTTMVIPAGKYANHYYSCNVSPIGLQDGVSSVMVVARDVTEKKNTDQMVLDALIEGQEKEQRRVARELHDGLGQLFTAMNIQLQVLKADLERADAKGAARSMKEVDGLVAHALTEVKGIGRNLLPDVLLHHGLIPAITDLRRSMQTKKTQIEFTVVGSRSKYPEKVELALYRSCQEMLNNCMKYAKAKNVSIQLVDHEDSVVLMVEDNGIGMTKSANPTSHGLNNIKTRAEALGGTFSTESKPGKGLLAYIEIPLER